MNRETDTVFLQTLGRFITAQVQLAAVPLLQKIEQLENRLASVSDIQSVSLENTTSLTKELDGAIEGFAAEIARVEKRIEEPSKPEADMDALFAYIENYIKAIPLPQNGKDGLNGKDGKDGPAGRDGGDVVAAFRDSDGHLILTLSNGITKDVGLIHGRDGKDGLPGKNGLDGFGFKDMSAVWDGERTLIFKFVLEDRVEEISVSIPFPLFRGIWKRGNEYTQGDSVGYEGSTWIALRGTDKQPGTSDSGWVLSTKRGLDGKPGEQGKQGLPGKDGERGRDLTQMGFDGKKW